MVGQSSGAVAATLAAARRPRAGLSLTLSEPPAFPFAADSAEAHRMARDLEAHLQVSVDEADWLRGFAAIVGGNAATPEPLPPTLADGVRAVRAIRRRPWQAELPIGQIAAASFSQVGHIRRPQRRVRGRLRLAGGQSRRLASSRCRRPLHHAAHRQGVQRNARDDPRCRLGATSLTPQLQLSLRNAAGE